MSNGGAHRLSRDRKPFPICCIKGTTDRFWLLIKVTVTSSCHVQINEHSVFVCFCLDSPAPCKVFPKTPKIALTLDDCPQSEYQRRKSSGSSVHSNSSTVEPHVYDFLECERNSESSLMIRLVDLFIQQLWLLLLISHSCNQDPILQSHCVC